MGLAIANKTSGGTGVGPGANKYRFSIDRSSFDDWWGTDWKRSGTLPLALGNCQESESATDEVFRRFHTLPTHVTDMLLPKMEHPRSSIP
jgi:hypothetical protein